MGQLFSPTKARNLICAAVSQDPPCSTSFSQHASDEGERKMSGQFSSLFQTLNMARWTHLHSISHGQFVEFQVLQDCERMPAYLKETLRTQITEAVISTLTPFIVKQQCCRSLWQCLSKKTPKKERFSHTNVNKR